MADIIADAFKAVGSVKFKPIEKDPTGRQLGEMGTKLDAGKTQVFYGALSYFPRAIQAVAQVSMAGRRKGYAWKSWETVPDGIMRYSDALGRHLLDETDGAYDNSEGGTGILHAAQVAWNALARLELMLKEGTTLYEGGLSK